LIASPGLDVDVATLLRACGGRYFGFNHMPLTQTVFAPFIRCHSASPVMGLQGGWDAYVQRLCEAQNTRSPGILTTIRQSTTRLARDKGPLRFEMHDGSASVLTELMRLKSEQWARTVGAANDPFAVPWIRQLMSDTLATQSMGFRGSLSTLYAGDKLVSSHFGLRAGATLHSWFPVFDLDYAYYQPGLILLKNIAEQGVKDGLTEIDLGRGTAGYKMRFKTDLIPLGEGAVSRPAIVASVAVAAKLAKAKVAADPRVVRFRQWRAARQAVPSVGVGVAENQKNGS
jgi:CelD/BcsL family acetyltransferase involved in cellulose biosynthesis